jgi:AraC-like DNA-binding protein
MKKQHVERSDRLNEIALAGDFPAGSHRDRLTRSADEQVRCWEEGPASLEAPTTEVAARCLDHLYRIAQFAEGQPIDAGCRPPGERHVRRKDENGRAASQVVAVWHLGVHIDIVEERTPGRTLELTLGEEAGAESGGAAEVAAAERRRAERDGRHRARMAGGAGTALALSTGLAGNEAGRGRWWALTGEGCGGVKMMLVNREDLVRLRNARDRIDREYAQPLDVPSLARTALMSTAHFSRLFRAAYGETPYGYVMTRRIERAKALLRRGDLSVTEVCVAVGCTSLGSFSSRFTELVGQTPSAYRARDHSATARVPSCAAKIYDRPSRFGEASAGSVRLA